MIKPVRPSKNKQIEVYEHLEHYVKTTTYAHRMQWLTKANALVRILEKNKITPPSKSR